MAESNKPARLVGNGIDTNRIIQKKYSSSYTKGNAFLIKQEEIQALNTRWSYNEEKQLWSNANKLNNNKDKYECMMRMTSEIVPVPFLAQ